jgi:ABC-2 type transport system permease protein
MNNLSSKKVIQIFSAEIYKLVSLPLIWFTLIGTFIFNLILAAAFTSADLQGATGTGNILDIGLASMGYLQAGFIILGILATCSEYTGGQIQTTLTSMPWRGFQLTLKHLTLAIMSAPVAVIIVTSGVLYPLIMMREGTAVVELSNMIKAIAGATGYLTLTTLISAAIGALFRRTIPALVVLLGYYFIVSPLSRQFPSSISNYFPDTAGYYMYMSFSPGGIDMVNTLTPMQAAGILTISTLFFIALAIVFYRKRDA